jgi:arginase
MADRAVIAVPYHLDEHLPGLDFVLPPDRVVTADLPGGGIWERLAAVESAVAGAVSAAAADGGCPVVVCGDCCTALAVVAGLQAAGQTPGIVWFDAHGDVQTPETTASGYPGGMPLRLLTGYRPELIAGRLGLRPVPEEHIVLAGARDLDPPEVSYLAASAIRQLDVAGVAAAGLPDLPLYVHVDLDVLDPGEVPGLRYPAPGGPAPAQLAGALRTLLATGRVAAITLACTWYPGHGAAARLSPLLGQALAGRGVTRTGETAN